MSNDEKKFQPIFQILHIKSAWFLLELAMALVTTIGMIFLQVCILFLCILVNGNLISSRLLPRYILVMMYIFLKAMTK